MAKSEEAQRYREQMMSKFRPASDFRRKYDIDPKEIGKGHFSKVYKARPAKNSKLNPNEEYAVKQIDMMKLEDVNELKALDNEIEILQKVNHPGIVKLYDVYSDSNEIWLVLEYLGAGDLFSRIIERAEDGLYTEIQAAKIVRHILEVLDYLHDMNIVHRDLKPENILLRDKNSDTRLKLADFGFAAHCEQPLEDPYGTPVYVAPEVLVGEPYRTSPDMWSLGVITYILLCGYPPFFNNDQEVLARMIVRTGFKFLPEDWSVVSDDAKNFIRGLLRKNPKKRFTAKQALRHEWIRNYSHNQTSTNITSGRHLTIKDELRKFKATLNIQKLFGILGALEKMNRLKSLTEGKQNESFEQVEHMRQEMRGVSIVDDSNKTMRTRNSTTKLSFASSRATQSQFDSEFEDGREENGNAKKEKVKKFDFRGKIKKAQRKTSFMGQNLEALGAKVAQKVNGGFKKARRLSDAVISKRKLTKDKEA